MLLINQSFRNTLERRHNTQVLLYHGRSNFHVLPITAPPAACGGTLPPDAGVSDERRSSGRDGGVRWRWQCGCGLGSWLKRVGLPPRWEQRASIVYIKVHGSSILLTAGLADAELNVVSCLPHIRRGMRCKGGMKRELQREREWGRMGCKARRGPVQCNAVRAGTDT